MRFGVYTIFKDEEKHARRWVQSVRDADYILAVDTGSSDGTAAILKDEAAALGIEITVLDCAVVPWRFDDARNFSLNALPRDLDFCVCLDLDEILVAGWKESLALAIAESPEATRLRYNYVWSWNADGSPGLTYYADKIHSRAGYQWRNPVHETLERDFRAGPEYQKFIESTLILHYPDNAKPRSQYFPLLELAVKERPENDRMAHYYGRELFFYKRFEEAIVELKRHLALPSAIWNEERAASCRYIGDSYWALGSHADALDWFNKANKEVECRENFVRLAQAWRALERWTECLSACDSALAFKDRPNNYINDPVTWSDWPEKMRAEALAAIESGEEKAA